METLTTTKVTTKAARQRCPKSPQKRDDKGRLLQSATPIVPFRAWARQTYAHHSPGSLGPKLRRIVHGRAA